MIQPSASPVSNDWWHVSQEQLVRSVNVAPDRGLSDDQVPQLRARYGAKAVDEIKPAGVWELILDGVKEPMMIVLLSIAVLSLIFGKPVEALVMVFVVAAYIAVEFINKYRSDRIMSRLRELTQPMTSVVRDGRRREIPTTDIVVGDILVLSEGVRVPADLRLLESHGLTVNEAPVTGESMPVKKNAGATVPGSGHIGRSRQLCLFGNHDPRRRRHHADCIRHFAEGTSGPNRKLIPDGVEPSAT